MSMSLVGALASLLVAQAAAADEPRAQAATETAGTDALPAVAIAVRGEGADEHSAYIVKRLVGAYRIVAPHEATLFIDVDSGPDGLIVEVRDPLGTLSKQEISTREEERDLLVWLVVRSALERASTGGEEAPPPVVGQAHGNVVAPPSPPPVAAPVAEPVWFVPAVALSGVVATGEDLAMELGPRVGASATLFELVTVGVEAGYRRQTAGPLTLHAVPISSVVSLRAGDVVMLSGGARVDVAPKWLAERDVNAVELSLGPTVALSLPVAELPLRLFVDAAVLAKLQRQGFVLDGVLFKESPWRAAVAVGCEWRWD